MEIMPFYGEKLIGICTNGGNTMNKSLVRILLMMTIGMNRRRYYGRDEMERRI